MHIHIKGEAIVSQFNGKEYCRCTVEGCDIVRKTVWWHGYQEGIENAYQHIADINSRIQGKVSSSYGSMGR